MHFSDDDLVSVSSTNKRYVWGKIRQVQSDSDTVRIDGHLAGVRSRNNLLPRRQRQQNRVRPPSDRQLITGNNQINHRLLQKKDSPLKPRVVTVVLPTTTRPFKRISLLLNRRSAASLEQLMLDITEAFQIPRWHNDHIRKLFTLRGKEIKTLVEIFRAPGKN